MEHEGSVSAPSSSSPVRDKLRALVVGCVRFFLLAVLFRAVALTLQQHQLRCTLRAASLAFASIDPPLQHWWDFGSLLGLVREHDMIYSEVDADVSFMADSRARLNEPANMAQLSSRGFVKFKNRDDDGFKLRVYHRYGWFLDMDVWKRRDQMLSDVRERVDGTVEAKDEVGTAPPRLQMVTGRHDPSDYNLPNSWFFPLQSLSVPLINGANCGADEISADAATLDANSGGVPLSIPNQPIDILRYWYSNTFMSPRQYDKGKDFSSDQVELFLWKWAVMLFDLFVAAKVSFKIGLNLVKYNVFWTVVTVLLFLFTGAAIVWYKRRKPDLGERILSYTRWVKMHEIFLLLVTALLLTLNSLDWRVVLYMAWFLPLLVYAILFTLFQCGSSFCSGEMLARVWSRLPLRKTGYAPVPVESPNGHGYDPISAESPTTEV
jgi:hypothetical protein